MNYTLVNFLEKAMIQTQYTLNLFNKFACKICKTKLRALEEARQPSSDDGILQLPLLNFWTCLSSGIIIL